MSTRSTGFTLVEIAIVLVIIGLLLGAVLQGQELIRSARVRNLIAEQDAVSTAILGFQDRFRALPGDYGEATTNITRRRAPTATATAGSRTLGAVPEYILVWTHLAAAGFLNGSFSATSSTASPRPGQHADQRLRRLSAGDLRRELGLQRQHDVAPQHQDRQSDPGRDHRRDRPQDRRRAARLGTVPVLALRGGRIRAGSGAAATPPAPPQDCDPMRPGISPSRPSNCGAATLL